jgi:hypothetical protein
MKDAVLYINVGLSRVSTIRATGSLTRPYTTEDLSDPHSDLFKPGPVCLAIETGDSQHPERYVYCVMGDGSCAVGRITGRGPDQSFIMGWLPYNPATLPGQPSPTGEEATLTITQPALLNWVSANTGTSGGDVWWTATYQSGVTLLEHQTDGYYLDGFVFINAVPPNLSVTGKGPIWWAAGATVTLMDGLVDYGDWSVDANGALVPQIGVPNQGMDLSSPTMIAGFKYSPTFVPFLPPAGPGEDFRQRMRRRRVGRSLIEFQNSTGFTWNGVVVPPYDFDDDPTQAPPLRGGVFRGSPTLGRDYDPVCTWSKDRPGPVKLIEISVEITV